MAVRSRGRRRLGPAQLRREVALLGVAVGPNLVALDIAALNPADVVVEEHVAGVPDAPQEREDGLFIDAHHPDRPANAAAFDQGGEDADTIVEREMVHTPLLYLALSIMSRAHCVIVAT
jgi:hypothetical protein